MFEGRIEERSSHAKAIRWEYLTSCNEDDQRVMIEAQEVLAGALERLGNADPLETHAIQSEQATIRLSKERITLLRNNIEVRAHEMNQLAAVARRLPKDGSDYVPGETDQSEKAEGSRRKGKKKVVTQTKKPTPRAAVSLAGGDGSNANSVPIHIPFPSVQAAIVQVPMINDVEASSPEEEGECFTLESESVSD